MTTLSSSADSNRVLDSQPNDSRHQNWRDIFLVFLMSLPLFFWQLSGWALLDPDEGRYAEIPREMLERGDWITPTLSYVKYFEKPPLFYWLVGGSFKLFGQNETAARLVPALCALCALFLTYFLARRMFNRRVGLLSALVLATNLFWPIMARSVIIDMTLSVALFGAVAFWWLAQSETAARKKWFLAAFWVSLSLAFLSKGPVAVLLTGASIFLYCALCRDGKAWRDSGWVWGIALTVFLVAPWFLAVALKNPEYNRFFWLEQNVYRFLGKGKNREHAEPIYYFLMWLPLLFFPWSFLVPAAIANGAKRIFPARTQAQRAVVFLLCNAGFVVLFFSVSTGKLLTYVLPAFPALSILIGVFLDRTLRLKAEIIWRKPLQIGVALLSATLFSLSAIAFLFSSSSTRLPRAMLKTQRQIAEVALPLSLLMVLGIVLLLWALSLCFALWKQRARLLVGAIGGGFSAFFVVIVLILQAVVPTKSVKTLVDFARPGLERGGQLTMFRSYVQSAEFYAGRRLVNIDGGGEIAFGIGRLAPDERAIWFPEGTDALQKLMNQPIPVYVLVESHKAAQQKILPRLNGTAVELMWNRKRSLIGNRAAAKITPPQIAP